MGEHTAARMAREHGEVAATKHKEGVSRRHRETPTTGYRERDAPDMATECVSGTALAGLPLNLLIRALTYDNTVIKSRSAPRSSLNQSTAPLPWTQCQNCRNLDVYNLRYHLLLRTVTAEHHSHCGIQTDGRHADTGSNPFFLGFSKDVRSAF